jgi:hypothetical protein
MEIHTVVSYAAVQEDDGAIAHISSHHPTSMSLISVREWSSRLYGANYARLRKIKAAVDPTDLFSGFGLAIQTKRSGRS